MAETDEYKVLIEQGSKDVAGPPHEGDEEDDDDNSSFILLLNLVLSGTARLNVLLPTATILAFAIFAPLLTDDGKCARVNRILTAAFVALCAASCVFFTLTDSFRSASGRLRYGVATPTGIRTFCAGSSSSHRKKGPREPEKYRLRWSDLFHSALALVAFVTFAASHHDIVLCYYPGVPRKVVNTVPLVIGFVVSLLFVMFPSKRRGIGYPFLLRTDLVYLHR
ncbi:hypothetical protein PR202_gb04009 [Eleusine coracana subsp. coracana]|uniref:Transmembrane protein n=1 Tax=Eleusine coracana subsp. coracana TaxID=191504 RepID=A0AAV5E3E5_ELECO|nr:hypothetical protein QOZ80_1BG0092000 [Eleusine coracana subsp. coracana]GJN16976.1 hypothetical protein PR202_gb04009 [Eleusine coracana subsp. coracana]